MASNQYQQPADKGQPEYFKSPADIGNFSDEAGTADAGAQRYPENPLTGKSTLETYAMEPGPADVAIPGGHDVPYAEGGMSVYPENPLEGGPDTLDET